MYTKPQKNTAELTEFKTLPYDTNFLGLPKPYHDKFFAAMNVAINAYNTATDTGSKKLALIQMQAAIDFIDIHLNTYYLAQSEPFHQLRSVFFHKIKQAYAEHGVSSMFKEGRADSPLARIISDISPDKADTLMEILYQGESGVEPSVKNTIQDELKNLYASNDQSLEAQQWRSFMKNHSIEFLGGSNSKNYKVTNIDPNSPNCGAVKVLKVDNRLSNPRNTDVHLRNKLPHLVTSIDADRQVRGIGSNAGQIVSNTLLVTDFCPSGCLFKYANHLHSQGTSKTLIQCGTIFDQMTQALLNIQGANLCFPDAKLTNWLIDSNRIIQIADTKSFVFTEDGIYQPSVSGNDQTVLLSTKQGFHPGELTHAVFDAEKLHSSLLGRNIYTFLTGESPNPINFSNKEIFKTEIGQEYRKLINALIKEPPHNRMSLAEAQKTLQDLARRAANENLDQKLKLFESQWDIDLKRFVNAPENKTPQSGVMNHALIGKLKTIEACLLQFDDVVERIIDNIGDKKLGSEIQKKLKEELLQAVSMAKTIDDIPDTITQFTRDIRPKFLNFNKTMIECYALMDAVSSLKLDDKKSLYPKHYIEAELGAELEKFNSIDNLNERIDQFKTSAASNLEPLKQKHTEYLQLFNAIKKLQVGTKDVEMEKFLKNCDKAVRTGETLNARLNNLTRQIDTMKTIHKGLTSAENEEIRVIIRKFDAEDSWNTIGMGKKARRIESAVANIPIEERAKLLESKNTKVTDLFDALASHRVSFISNTKNDHGMIDEKKAANTFKDFKNKFIQQMRSRDDVASEEKENSALEQARPGPQHR